MARITAIAGAAFMFVAVYCLAGLPQFPRQKDSPLEWARVIFTFGLSAGVAELSYEATMKRYRKRPGLVPGGKPIPIMERKACTPLVAPNPPLYPDTVWYKRLWLPAYRRYRSEAAQIDSQLRERHHFPVDDWQSETQDVTLAEDVGKAIISRIPWPNHYFLPTDSLSLLLLDPDGMGIFEASFAIQKELGFKIDLKSVPVSGNFRDLVEHVGRIRSAA